jgi:hypothetical protein
MIPLYLVCLVLFCYLHRFLSHKKSRGPQLPCRMVLKSKEIWRHRIFSASICWLLVTCTRSRGDRPRPGMAPALDLAQSSEVVTRFSDPVWNSLSGPCADPAWNSLSGPCADPASSNPTSTCLESAGTSTSVPMQPSAPRVRPYQLWMLSPVLLHIHDFKPIFGNLKSTDGTICYVNLSTCEGPSDLFVAMANPHWREAINFEFSALTRNKTWHLVPAPSSGWNLIDSNGVSKLSPRQMDLLTVIRSDCCQGIQTAIWNWLWYIQSSG